MRLNVAAGTNNAQSNVVSIQLSTVVSDSALANKFVQTQAVLSTDDASRNHVTIAPGVLRGANGVVQINQTAGNGNASLNSLGLRMHP
ncbi:MAG: hypothetical protein NVSMB5_05720 [Candidatus Velthaea sp.]